MEKVAKQPVYEPYDTPRMNKGGVLRPLACLAVLIVVAIWAGIGITVGDFLWFLPVFRAEASAIDLYWDGQLVHVQPGTPEYALIQEAAFAELPRVQSHAKGVGLSDETLEELRQQGRLLELHYAQPARIHTTYNFGESSVYYVPLSGHHAERRRVFNASQGAPLQLTSITQILAAAEEIAGSAFSP